MGDAENVAEQQHVRNYVGGEWTDVDGSDGRDIVDTATGDAVARITFSTGLAVRGAEGVSPAP